MEIIEFRYVAGFFGGGIERRGRGRVRFIALPRRGEHILRKIGR